MRKIVAGTHPSHSCLSSSSLSPTAHRHHQQDNPTSKSQHHHITHTQHQSMPSVAVIGAGAAGLVASRHLLKCGVRPCIFEASQVVGGSWNADNQNAYKMWDHLSPNLSKYTCVFSDHLWPLESPPFPTRQELNQYLVDYSSSHLQEQCSFRMGCTVTGVKRRGSETTTAATTPFTQPFQVEWTTTEGTLETEEFDGVIVATGFFAEPWVPAGMQQQNVLHSSEYRSPNDFTNQTVAVCGASFSALEIAADVRKQAKKVISILPRIPYVVPRFVRHGSAFAPLDAVLYQRRQEAPQEHSLEMTAEESQQKHAFLRQLVGDRKQQALGIPKDTSVPPMVAISDDYLNLVVDESIEVVHGKVAETTSGGDNKVNIQLENGDSISDIDQVIACTGYRSQLSFLEAEILETLEYDATDTHAPLTLCNEAFHPDIPGLGFVGMYRGPYFGVMELQARLLAGMMSGTVEPSSEYIQQALEASKKIRTTKPQPQFPRYDYVGFMDNLAEPLGLIPQGDCGAKGAMVSPPFFNNEDDKNSKEQWKQAIDKEMSKGQSCNIAQVALSALIGKWKFSRSIVHFNAPDQPPQRITGVIGFSQIPPADGKEWNAALYHEDGLFRLPNGKDMEVFREYEYETKDNGILEIYFVEGGKRAHLFLSLQFTKQENEYWVATSDHLCIKDLYKGTFQIALEGLSASHITMTYRVKGPNKDYESVTDLRPC